MRRILLILPCNKGAFYGDYSLGSGWRLIEKTVKLFISRGELDLASIDCINAAGIVPKGVESQIVKGGDRYPSWEYFKRNPDEVNSLAQKVALQLRYLANRYDDILAYINVKAYRLVLEKAAKVSSVPIKFIDLSYSPLSFRSLRSRLELVKQIRISLKKNPEIYFCFPDFAESKIKALRRIYKEDGLRINVLVSYANIKRKPSMINKLIMLRKDGLLNNVMLDNGAYELFKKSLTLRNYKDMIKSYISFIYRYDDMFDYIVAPDVPNNALKTLEFSKLFLKEFEGDMNKVILVIQGRSLKTYLEMIHMLGKLGIKPTIIGIGGVDYFKKKKKWEELTFILNYLTAYFGAPIHLFGATRLILKRLGIYFDSCDLASWLYDVKYRRNKLNVSTSEQATYMALKEVYRSVL